MHLLKVPLEVLTSSYFITTKSTMPFSTHADGLKWNCSYSQLSGAEWKTIFSGLEVAFTTFMLVAF